MMGVPKCSTQMQYQAIQSEGQGERSATGWRWQICHARMAREGNATRRDCMRPYGGLAFAGFERESPSHAR